MLLETTTLEFGEFLLDQKEKTLLRNGERLPINPKTFQLLVTLLEERGHLIEKERLMKTLWPDSFVEDANLAFTVSLLRKTLGDDPQNPRFIETVPRRGYRFIGQTVQAKTSSENDRAAEASSSPGHHRRIVLTAVPVIALIALFGAGFVWLTGDVRPAGQPRMSPVARTSIGNVTNAVVTPDGRQIVFSRKDGAGEALWRTEIASGEQVQLVPAQAAEYTGLSVSPKNDFAYFSIFAANNAVATLARVPLAGGPVEPLSDVAADVSVTFSPDGGKIAFTENLSSVNETYLKTANADGSNQRTIVTTKASDRDFPIFRASPAAWSPDGTTIAVAIRESDENGFYYKILLVDPESGAQSEVVGERWNEVVNISWLSDTDLVLIDSEPGSASRNLWRVSAETGKRTKVSHERAGFDWLSTSGGKIYTVQKKIHSGLFVADFAGSSRSLRSKQIYAEANSIETVAWNKNGQILFNSGESGKNEVWRIDPDGTAPQQITFDSGLSGTFAVSPLDDSLVFSANKERRKVLFSTDAAGQNFNQLTDGTSDLNPSISADGNTVVFQRGTMKPTLWSANLNAGQPASQVTGYYAQNPEYSPDGNLISFHFMDYGDKEPKWKLGLIDSATRRLVNKLDFPAPIANRETSWDPQAGLVTMSFQAGNGAGILLMNPLTGEYFTIKDIGSGAITSLAWSIDGRSLVYAQKHETTDVVELTAAY